MEAGRVVSLVRYGVQSLFPAHDHPDGEEILVLEGQWEGEGDGLCAAPLPRLLACTYSALPSLSRH